MIIKQASDLHFTYVRNTPELREAFINKCKEFGVGICGIGGEKYLEVYSGCYDEFEICGTDDLEAQSKELTMSDLTDTPTETPRQRKDRERACAIYDMCAEADIFTEESNFWAGKFYDLGYKKEKTHGTN